MGIQSPQGLQVQPKNTYTSDHTCISETLGFTGKQHASNRIRGFEVSVSVSQASLRVFLTIFLSSMQRRRTQDTSLQCTGVRKSLSVQTETVVPHFIFPPKSLDTAFSSMPLLQSRVRGETQTCGCFSSVRPPSPEELLHSCLPVHPTPQVPVGT